MSNFRRGVKASGDRFSIDSPVNNQRGEMLRQFKNLGENVFSPQISKERDNIVAAAKNSDFFSPVLKGYNRVEPYLPNLNLGEKKVSYDYERPVGPGILSIGADYDYGNNNFGLSGRYKIEYDDGGIATLPTPEGMQRERVPLTDEQKDYLYDYMLDFMFKQKQREQMEQESIIPPFNYEGLEV
jgi:hypothetical protein